MEESSKEMVDRHYYSSSFDGSDSVDISGSSTVRRPNLC